MRVFYYFYFFIFLFLILFCYFFIDKNLIILINQSLSPAQIHGFNLFTQIGNGWVSGIIFVLGFLYFKWKGIAQGQRKSLYLLSSFLISGFIADLLKNILGRARPELLIQHNLFGFYFFKFHALYWSFPSGHSATLGACGMGLFLIFKNFKYKALFLIFAFLISACRVLALAHYPSDVLAGFYLGCMSSIFIYPVFYKKLKIKN